jgi:hypothetical protein
MKRWWEVCLKLLLLSLVSQFNVFVHWFVCCVKSLPSIGSSSWALELQLLQPAISLSLSAGVFLKCSQRFSQDLSLLKCAVQVLWVFKVLICTQVYLKFKRRFQVYTNNCLINLLDHRCQAHWWKSINKVILFFLNICWF